MPPCRLQRLPGLEYLGEARYFVTMCCGERLFGEAASVTAVRTQLLRTADSYRFAVLAYTFMPDHVHLLVEGTSESSDFRRFITTWRRRSSAALWTVHPHGLWQHGYYERILRREEASVLVCHYIFNNPVRAGLVEDPADYPFGWSCL